MLMIDSNLLYINLCSALAESFYICPCVCLSNCFLSWILAVCHVHLFIDLVVEYWYCCALFYTFFESWKEKEKEISEKKKIMIKKASER